MDQTVGKFVGYMIWIFLVSAIGWLAIKINGNVVSFWSVVTGAIALQLLIAPFMVQRHKE